MANEIENFDTGEQDNSNLIHIELDPKQNIENKKYFKNLFNKFLKYILFSIFIFGSRSK